MGRRRGLLGTLLNEMERSARRAQSARRLEARRERAAQGRALERELVRQERAEERARIQQERERQRAAADAQKARAQQQKQLSKQAQLDDWRLEVEEHQERDDALLSFGNESPEVEDREQLYQQLMEERPYEPPTFERPQLTAAVLGKIRDAHQPELMAALAATPTTPTSQRWQLAAGAGAIAAGGTSVLQAAPDMTPWASVACLCAWLGLEYSRRVDVQAATEKHRAEVLQDFEARIAEAQQQTQRQLESTALSQFEEEVEKERAAFQYESTRRRAHLQALQSGDTKAMSRELADMFPLDGPVPWPVRTAVKDARTVGLEVTVQLSTCMQTRAASVLASGKASFKKKTQKRFREECERVVAGIALHHASEAMLLLPSVEEVQVRCICQHTNKTTGVAGTVVLLAVTYDYQTLAPLQMPAIDPFAALQHFKHEVAVKDVALAVLAEATE